MNQEQIIQMAQEARLAFDSEEYPDIWQTYMYVGREEIEAFAKLVAEHEREACAKVAKTISDKYGWGHYGNEVDTADEIEAAIRARGQA